MQLFLDRGVDVEMQDNVGMTALHHACSDGNFATAQLLVKLGADTTVFDKTGSKPLDYLESKSHRRALNKLSSRAGEGVLK